MGLLSVLFGLPVKGQLGLERGRANAAQHITGKTDAEILDMYRCIPCDDRDDYDRGYREVLELQMEKRGIVDDHD